RGSAKRNGPSRQCVRLGGAEPVVPNGLRAPGAALPKSSALRTLRAWRLLDDDAHEAVPIRVNDRLDMEGDALNLSS
ncbi:MAG: hypothetical protein ACYDEA_06370, partial [Candidatus Dormibacteria bacterium]